MGAANACREIFVTAVALMAPTLAVILLLCQPPMQPGILRSGHSQSCIVLFGIKKNKATGVRIIDAETNETFEYYAPLIFLNASALGTTQIMLQSKSERFPDGFANSSGVLGHYLMDHYSGTGALAGYTGYEDQYYFGQRSTSVYVPRFQNLERAG